jgi:hypothetical protein
MTVVRRLLGVIALLGTVSLLPATSAAAEPWAGYRDGFVIEDSDGQASFQLNARVQAGVFFEDVLGTTGDSELAFQVRSARLQIRVALFDRLDIRADLDFGRGGFDAKDVYANLTLLEPWIQLRVGQFRIPFARRKSQVVKLQRFVLKSRLAGDFGAGRDIGLMLHDGWGSEAPFEYALAFVNGAGSRADLDGEAVIDLETGEGQITGGGFSNVPDAFHPLIVGRVGLCAGASEGCDEIVQEFGGFAFALGASAMLDFGPMGEATGATRAQLDYLLRAGWFTHTFAAFVGTAQDGDRFDAQAFDAFALQAELAAMIGGKVEPALRYEVLYGNADRPNEQTVLVGATWYIDGQRLKWVIDGGVHLVGSGRVTPPDPAVDYSDAERTVVVRTLLQAGF